MPRLGTVSTFGFRDSSEDDDISLSLPHSPACKDRGAQQVCRDISHLATLTNSEGSEGLNCCAVYNKGTRALCGGSEGTLVCWDLTTRTELRSMSYSDVYQHAVSDGHVFDVACIGVSADGTLAITGSDDGSYWHAYDVGVHYCTALIVWDLSAKIPTKRGSLVGHTGRINCCAVFGGGTRALSAGYDESASRVGPVLRVWDLTRIQFWKQVDHEQDPPDHAVATIDLGCGEITCCAVFASDTQVLFGVDDETVRVWDIAELHEQASMTGHTGRVNCCSVVAGGARALSGSEDNTLRVWDLSQPALVATLEGHTNSVLCCSVYAHGRRALRRALSGGRDAHLRVWDLGSYTELATIQPSHSVVACAAFQIGSTTSATEQAITQMYTFMQAGYGNEDGINLLSQVCQVQDVCKLIFAFLCGTQWNMITLGPLILGGDGDLGYQDSFELWDLPDF